MLDINAGYNYDRSSRDIGFSIDRDYYQLGMDDVDLIFIENVGNLVCPAEFDTGASINITILSVPEAVSYTHLDVYKRQILHGVLLIF